MIIKGTIHPEGRPSDDFYPKTSADQVEGLDNTIREVVAEASGGVLIYQHKFTLKPDLDTTYYIKAYSSRSEPYVGGESILADLLTGSLLFRIGYGSVLPTVGCIISYIPRDVNTAGNYGELAFRDVDDTLIIVDILSFTDTVIEV